MEAGLTGQAGMEVFLLDGDSAVIAQPPPACLRRLAMEHIGLQVGDLRIAAHGHAANEDQVMHGGLTLEPPLFEECDQQQLTMASI